MIWIQRQLILPSRSTGFYPITKMVIEAIPEISEVKIGLLNLFLQHTSASLTINENADPNVLCDLGDGLDRLVPISDQYAHTIEGEDDMPGHIKSSLMGVSQTIPIASGQLQLGTWQDIYVCEFRVAPHRRKIIMTLNGQELDS